MSDAVLTVLLIVAALFAASALLIAAAQTIPATRDKAKAIWPLYASEFLIVAAILVSAALGGIWLTVAALLFAWRGIFEMFDLFGGKAIAPLPLTLMVGAVLILLTARFSFVLMPLMFLIVGIGILAVIAIEFRKLERAHVNAAVLAFFYPLLAVALTLALIAAPNGFLWLVFVYATVEINDAFALLTGKLFGKRRILPKLSPGKTEAGLIGGLVMGGAAGFALAQLLLELPKMEAAIASLIALIAGLAGDLATSWLKRARNKKDFAPVLKQHGGLLDIYDSLLFAAPTVLIWRLIG